MPDRPHRPDRSPDERRDRPQRVTVWHLELTTLRPSAGTADIRRAEQPFGPLNRFFYEEIGREFSWVDKEGWSRHRWQRWAEEVETWLVLDRGTPAGYAELKPRPDSTEIEMFGLLAPFRGRGLGGALLTRVAQRARELAGRVTVETCELDGPYARAAYEARGFRVVREEVVERRRRDLLQ